MSSEKVLLAPRLAGGGKLRGQARDLRLRELIAFLGMGTLGEPVLEVCAAAMTRTGQCTIPDLIELDERHRRFGIEKAHIDEHPGVYRTQALARASKMAASLRP